VKVSNKNYWWILDDNLGALETSPGAAAFHLAQEHHGQHVLPEAIDAAQNGFTWRLLALYGA